jgi:hypothetical protein
MTLPYGINNVIAKAGSLRNHPSISIRLPGLFHDILRPTINVPSIMGRFVCGNTFLSLI